MCNTFAIACVCTLLAGCNTLTGADSGLRLVEYGAGGFVAPITGQAGGVAVHQWGDAAPAAVLICRRSDDGAALVRTAGITPAEVQAVCAGVPDVSH